MINFNDEQLLCDCGLLGFHSPTIFFCFFSTLGLRVGQEHRDLSFEQFR